MVGVLHVGDADGGVADPVVHHRVHRHRHAVLGQHLRQRDSDQQFVFSEERETETVITINLCWTRQSGVSRYSRYRAAGCSPDRANFQNINQHLTSQQHNSLCVSLGLMMTEIKISHQSGFD